MAREHAIDGGFRRRIRHLGLQRALNRLRAILAQDALITQRPAKFRNLLLNIGANAIPGPAGLTISKIDAIQPSAMRASYPQLHGALTEAKRSCCLTHAHTCSNSLHHVPAAQLNGCFLPMFSLLKKPSHYKNCPANADTRLSGER